MPSQDSLGRPLRILLFAASSVIVLAGIQAAQSIVIPILMAGFLAVICWPPLKWLQDRKVPTGLALLIVLVLISSAGLLLVGLLTSSAADFREKLPVYTENLRAKQDAALVWLDEKGFDTEQILKKLKILPKEPQGTQQQETDPLEPIGEKSSAAPTDAKQPPDPKQPAEPPTVQAHQDNEPKTEATSPLTKTLVPDPLETPLGLNNPPGDDFFQSFEFGNVFKMAGGLVSGLVSVLSSTVVILLILAFMLLEASDFPKKLLAISGKSNLTDEKANRIADNIRRYVSAKTFVSLVTAALVFIWLRILGIDNPVLWGVLAFFFNFVPNIGSVIAAIPPVLLAVIQKDLSTAIYVALGYVVVNVVIGNVVEPRMMGRRLGLSTLVVFLSLIFWGWILGPVGMLLSVPLTMIAKIALETYDETRWIAILMSADAPPAEETKSS